MHSQVAALLTRPPQAATVSLFLRVSLDVNPSEGIHGAKPCLSAVMCGSGDWACPPMVTQAVQGVRVVFFSQ